MREPVESSGQSAIRSAGYGSRPARSPLTGDRPDGVEPGPAEEWRRPSPLAAVNPRFRYASDRAFLNLVDEIIRAHRTPGATAPGTRRSTPRSPAR
ncbi:MAG: hypothetical protein WC558_09410 [Patulibacter sp.]